MLITIHGIIINYKVSACLDIVAPDSSEEGNARVDTKYTQISIF